MYLVPMMIKPRTVIRLFYTRLRLYKGRRQLILGLLFAVTILSVFTHIRFMKGPMAARDELNNIHIMTSEVLRSYSEKDITVVMVMIHSSGDSNGSKRRTAARSTWMSGESLNYVLEKFGTQVICKFVLGGKDLPREAMQRLTVESEQYDDIVILNEIRDDHETLTDRTLSSFVYFTKTYEEYKPQFALKCDDDTFVNIIAIVDRLHKRKNTGKLYWGEFVGGYPVLAEGPYAEHGWNICDRYLPYAYGGGYLVSWDLLKLVVENTENLVKYGNEDVTLSVWLAPYNIERIHDQGFDTGSDSKGCIWPFIVAHKISVNDTYNYYNSMLQYGRICGEMQKSGEVWWARHMYNWKVAPSNCCEILNNWYYF